MRETDTEGGGVRIRSTKPEFWRSARIASVSWDARLVLKGLESYVDDNGVGRDDIALIVGDVFSRDMLASPRETVARVSEAISQLHQAGLLHRYEVGGDHLLFISWWESIQRIDKPGKGRFPRPDGTMDYRSSEIRESVARPREGVAPGTGEQGNRGTGETPPPVPAKPHQRARESKAVARMNELNATSRSGPGNEVARSYDTWAGGGIDTKTQIEVAQEVDTLLADGIDAHQIAEGIKAWHHSDSWSPTQIRRFVAKAARPVEGRNSDKPTKATLRAVDTIATAEALIAEFHQETA
ncbi:hypothetical protein ACPXB3_22235 [Gordonia sp. DT219]|uniref:hypothetical protein n=1 Tax=Gordonia sp. DT219 TaxID=3416658 RepID=UPI003CEA2C7F